MPSSEELYNELDDLIRRYITQVWEENDATEEGDAIGAWALILNYGNYNNRSMTGYTGTFHPQNMAPHAVKGLFGEGVEWVLEQQAYSSQENE